MIDFFTKYPEATFALLGTIITGIISVILAFVNQRALKNERNFNLQKEEYFKLQEKVEVIYEALQFYYENISIIVYNINNKAHNIERFSSENLEKRKSDNFNMAHNYLYLYFNTLYNEYFLTLMDSYKDIIDDYFENFLGAVRTGDYLNYSLDDIARISEKQKKFNQKHIEFLDLLNKEIDSRKELLLKK